VNSGTKPAQGDTKKEEKKDSLIKLGGPSSSTYIGAAFETMGYRAQALLLGSQWYLFLSLGVFLWVCVAISSIFHFVVEQKVEGMVWLLIGPILFTVLLVPRVRSTGAEWRIGAGAPLTNPMIERAQGSEVSWAFHLLNNTVANAVRTVSAVLSQDERRSELKKFMTRQRILDDLLTMEVRDGALKSFMMTSLAMCNAELGYARNLALGARDASFRATPAYQAAFANKDRAATRDKNLPLSPVAREYVKERWESKVKLSDPTRQVCSKSFEYLTTEYNANEALSSDAAFERFYQTPVSCEDLWCILAIGVHEDTSRALEGKQRELGIDNETWRELLVDIAEKLSVPQVNLDLDGKPVLGATPAPPDPSAIPIIVGGYMMRKAMQGDFYSGLVTELQQRANIERFEENYSVYTKGQQLQKHLFRGMTHQIATAKRYEFFTTLSHIPYLQALLLYVLAFSFPFFCLLVILPGKAEGFLLWVKMWLWVKSLDIGWIVLALIDDVLWQLMPHSSEWDILKDPNSSPITMFEAAFQGDPSYSVATYYSVMGVLLTGVPILLSQVLLGSANSIFSKLMGGISEFGGRLGGLAQPGASQPQLLASDYLREIYYARYATKRLGQDSVPESAYVRSAAKDMRDLAQKWKVHKAENLPIPFFVAAGVENQLNSRQAAVELERLAQRLEASLVAPNAYFSLFEGAKTDIGYNLDALRAGLSARGEYWNQPLSNPEGFGSLYSVKLTKDQAVAGATAFRQWAEQLNKVGMR
jgi:hypothetical protein